MNEMKPTDERPGPVWRLLRWLGRQFIVGDGGVVASLTAAVIATAFTVTLRHLPAHLLPTSVAGRVDLLVSAAGGLTVLVVVVVVIHLVTRRTRPPAPENLTPAAQVRPVEVVLEELPARPEPELETDTVVEITVTGTGVTLKIRGRTDV